MVRFTGSLVPLNRVTQEVDRIFSRVLNEMPEFGVRSLHSNGAFPAINLWDAGAEYRLEAELPGLALEDLEITVKDEELTLSGQRKLHDETDGRYHLRERVEGRFRRTLRLPAQLDADNVEATLSNGVLRVRLPKAPELAPRKVEVKVAT